MLKHKIISGILSILFFTSSIIAQDIASGIKLIKNEKYNAAKKSNMTRKKTARLPALISKTFGKKKNAINAGMIKAKAAEYIVWSAKKG